MPIFPIERSRVFTLALLGGLLLSACPLHQPESAKRQGNKEALSAFGDKVIIHTTTLSFEDPSTRIATCHGERDGLKAITTGDIILLGLE